MPRDAKGNVFGHGSKMLNTKNGHQFTVVGFATIAHGRLPIDQMPKLFGRDYAYYRWVDVVNLNEKEDSKEAKDTTDHCAVDRAQVAAMDLPEGVTAMAADDGDKVIWGS